MKPRKSGFTLIELLVVVSIIALLVSILLPALGQAREQAKRAVDASQLHTIGISLNMYTGEYNGYFPPSYGGFWMNELSMFTSNYIIDNGGDRKTFYCPCNKGRDVQYGGDYDPEDPWDWQSSLFWRTGATATKLMSENPADLGFDYDTRFEWRRTTYFWLLKAAPGEVDPSDYWSGTYRRSNVGLNGTYESVRPHVLKSGIDGMAPYRELVAKTSVKGAADVELVVDMMMTLGWDPSQYYYYTISEQPGAPIYENSSHLSRGGEELQGGHNLFVDGHVDWESFNETYARYMVHGALSGEGQNFPVHWW